MSASPSPARIALWLLLALPAAGMAYLLASGTTLAMDFLHPSGEMSVRLMIAAMLPGPLSGIFEPNRFLRGWLAIRRNLGVAAFGYAMLHLAFYLIDMGVIAAIVDELALPPIWTGWLAFALMIAPAAISHDAAMRLLGRSRWKCIQRLVYPVLAISLIHWWLLDWEWRPAAIHLVPLLGAWIILIIVRNRNDYSARSPTQ